jgi:UDP-GlcNAc:undecaprenyl-phosphate GlcNAc-1-phosphate transferase
MSPLRTYVFAFLAALLLSLLLTPLVRYLAVKGNFVARPRDDRWHKSPTSLLGGVSIFLTLMVVWLIASVAIGFNVCFRPLFPLALGCITIFLLGLADDLFEINPQHKLVGQIIIASILVIFGFQVNWFESLTANLVISIFWIIGIINAFNLLDNMDGLSAGIALIAALFLFLTQVYISPAVNSSFPAMLLLSVFIGTILGFLFYNFNPASIFMGDSGSLLIGFLLAGLTTEASGLMVGPRSGHLVSVLAIPILILFVPILDTTFVSLMRKVSGRSISVGGKDHSSHRMVAIGFSEKTAVFLLYGFAAISGLLAMATTRFSLSVSLVLVVIYFLFIIFFWIYLARAKVYPEESILSEVKEGKFTPILIEITYKRRLFEVMLDLILIPLAYWCSYLLRFEGSAYSANFTVFLKSLPIVVACQLFSFFLFGVYRGIWQYVGMRDVVTYVKAITAGTVLSVLVNLGIYRFMGFSRTLFVIYWMILIALVTASRFSYRLIDEAAPKNHTNAGRRSLIYGAGSGGQVVMREIEKNENLGLALVGFIDDNIQKQNRRLKGYPVFGGKDRLNEIVKEYRISEVIISFRNMDKGVKDSLRRDCNALGVNVRRLKILID